MRSLLVAATVAVTALVASPAIAADAPPPPAKRQPAATTTMHYPTLEKMLRRFSRQAGESRTRG